MTQEIRMILQYPPSVNKLYRFAGRRMYMTKYGIAYKAHVCQEWVSTHGEAFPADVRLWIEINAYPPDKRRRDVDNLNKIIFDALENAGVFANDAQIKKMTVIMHEQEDKIGKIDLSVGVW